MQDWQAIVTMDLEFLPLSRLSHHMPSADRIVYDGSLLLMSGSQIVCMWHQKPKRHHISTLRVSS